MRDGATRPACTIFLVVAALASPASAAAREAGDPIRLAWTEGDVAGMSTVWDADAREPIGFVEYHQSVRGDLLSTSRVTRFRDGSSD